MSNSVATSDYKHIYMVFTYYTGTRGSTKHVRGVYLTPEEAIARQKELIPGCEFTMNGVIYGNDQRGVSSCSFTEVFPLGNGNTPLHTTSIPNWQQYC